MEISLSVDQQEAFGALIQAINAGNREVVLTGPAGSGKTTLMRAVIDWASPLRTVALMAPTGKAASRLRTLTGRPASTIHRLLYEKTTVDEEGNLVFSDVRAVAPAGSLVIVDEASMVGKALQNDFLSKMLPGVQILYVGDAEQLPPVNDSYGPDLLHPTAALSQVHRQALESPIIRVATAVRSGIKWQEAAKNELDNDDMLFAAEADAVDWLVERRSAGIDATLLCFSNNKRIEINNAVRSALKHTNTLDIGDTIVCLRNNTTVGLMNGDTRVVAAIDDLGDLQRIYWTTPDSGSAYVVQSHIANGSPLADWRYVLDAVPSGGARKSAIPVDYGECITVHKSQGSQWDEVGFVHDDSLSWLRNKDPVQYRKLVYTAVTRSAKKLAIFYR